VSGLRKAASERRGVMDSSSDRFVWDATASLEAAGSAELALWRWDPAADRLQLTGATRATGLAALGSQCSSAALLAMVIAEDRPLLTDALRPGDPATNISVRLRLRDGGVCLWRGAWAQNTEIRATGVAALETRLPAVRLDPLTGLLERGAFLRVAADRLQAPGALALLVADLDRLRRLNEALGHERADMVLAALGARFVAAFPEDALMARIGEDEFAVLTRAPVDIEGVRQALEKPLRVAGFDIYPSLTFGAFVVEGGPDAPEAAEVLRRAALELEQAKAARRAPSMSTAKASAVDGLSRLALEGELRSALARGELTPYYQPVVRLQDGCISGFEALVRWVHPRRGLVMPDEFLPLLGEMGLMEQLGAHMLQASARQLAAWRAAHPAAGDLTVSVNLSTGEIDRRGLIDDVGRIISEARLPSRALKLEITESDIMRDPDAAAMILRALRGVGAGLSLDDFGTGFSSLSYLTRLPFDVLKVDRYFVRTMAAHEGSSKIVRSVVNLGRDLDLEVVAEGVENLTMAKTLSDLGCDYGQGFGYAPALSAADAEAYLITSCAEGAAPVRAMG
jgi:c-di-GMP-specific phosphodiesterase